MGFFSKSVLVNKTTAAVQTIPRCGRCGLFRQCTSPRMKPTGKGIHKILFIGEAPGQQEDRQGVQLIGDSGQLLRRTLGRLGMDLDDCWKTNAVICRPPMNKIEDKYIDACRPTIYNTIKKLQPNVVILLGMSAVKSIIMPEWKKDLSALTRWAGWQIPFQPLNTWLCPTYHPAFLLRSGEDELLQKVFSDHLKNALKLEKKTPEFLDIKQLKSQVEIIKRPSAAILRMKELSRKTGLLAFDFETTGLKPDDKRHQIVSCSFCLNGEDTFACKTPAETLSALSAVLKNPDLKKIASNIKFEQRWTKAKLGHRVAGWYWDTMLAAHCIDNRQQITSVKFQAFIWLGIADYSSSISSLLESNSSNGMNKIYDIDLDDLLLYNGLDSLLEYKVMEKQRRFFRE